MQIETRTRYFESVASSFALLELEDLIRGGDAASAPIVGVLWLGIRIKLMSVLVSS